MPRSAGFGYGRRKNFAVDGRRILTGRRRATAKHVRGEVRLREESGLEGLQLRHRPRGLQQSKHRFTPQVYLKEHPSEAGKKAIPGPGSYKIPTTLGVNGNKYSMRAKTKDVTR